MELDFNKTLWTLCCLFLFLDNALSGNLFSRKACVRPQDNPMPSETSIVVSGDVDCVRQCLQVHKCEQIMCRGVLVSPQSENSVSCTEITNMTVFSGTDDSSCHNSEYSIIVYERIVGNTCPDGWIFFNQNCYKTGTTGTFLQARAACHNEGAYLVKPMTEAENSFIYQLTGQSNTWIGVDDLIHPDVFMWEDGCPLLEGEGFWQAGEPNDSDGDEGCVHLFTHYGGRWNDERCDMNFRYVCQRSPEVG